MELNDYATLIDSKLAQINESIKSLKELSVENAHLIQVMGERIEEKLKKEIERDRAGTDALIKTVYGNGTQGMTTRLCLIESKIVAAEKQTEMFNEQLNKIKQEIMGYVKLAAFAVISSLVSVLGLIGTKIFHMVFDHVASR